MCGKEEVAVNRSTAHGQQSLLFKVHMVHGHIGLST